MAALPGLSHDQRLQALWRILEDAFLRTACRLAGETVIRDPRDPNHEG